MRKLLILVLFLGGLYFSYSYWQHSKDYAPEMKEATGKKRTRKRAVQKKKPAKKKSSTVNDVIDYTTGYTHIRAYHSSKEKIDKVKRIRDKRINEVMSD